MKVLICASECSPLVKVGGIADVIGSLPVALRKQGIDVRVVLPFYQPLEESINNSDLTATKVKDYNVQYDKKDCKTELYETVIPNTDIKVYLIRNMDHLSQGGIYYSPRVMNSPSEELNRFAFFSKAISEVFGRTNDIFNPQLLHCNDWHTGMVPQVVQNMYRYQSEGVPKSIFTIHNLAYQGFSKVEVIEKLGIDIREDESLRWDAQDDNVDFVLQGIVGANFVTTVSEKYSKEIQTPEFGEGLDDILKSRKDRLVGILNGISYEIFNPATDENIYAKYGLSDITEKKQQNKNELQKEIGLEVTNEKPLLGIISRLVSQKGLDLVAESIKEITDIGYQVVVLGTGDPQLELRFKELNENEAIKESYTSLIQFSEPLARKIYAASDMFLIPSRYEPCGLTQMIAMKYGTVPIVRGTGGLYDTVQEGSTGFVFEKFNAIEMKEAIKRAFIMYVNESSKWKEMSLRCMNEDFSWDESAKKYINLYQKVISS